MKTGPRNLITDVEGLRVGNSEDHRIKTGTTVLVADRPFRASVDVMGGSPGSRETELLAPDKLVEDVDALVLSGGSAFGLDAASGVTDGLRRMGRGFGSRRRSCRSSRGRSSSTCSTRATRTGTRTRIARSGAAALANAGTDFALGTAGAGVGALTANLKGGLGSASLLVPGGYTVGALVAANPTGSVTMGDSRHFWAAPFEVDGEFGGFGPLPGSMSFQQSARTKRDWVNPIANTTIAIVATDADLSKAQLKRLAVAAQDGIARGAVPAHTQVDGDLVFSVSTGARPIAEPVLDVLQLGHAAAVCLSRAMARAVYLATPAAGDVVPTWREKWG